MSEKLKYLFSAKFADGVVIDQTPEDKGKVEGTSEFTDILERAKTVKLNEFYLAEVKEDKSIGVIVGVSLINGYFLINGVELFPYTTMPKPLELTDFEIVFYRKHLRHIRQSDLVEIGHEVVYQFGWKAKDKDGHVVQRIFEIM